MSTWTVKFHASTIKWFDSSMFSVSDYRPVVAEDEHSAEEEEEGYHDQLQYKVKFGHVTSSDRHTPRPISASSHVSIRVKY